MHCPGEIHARDPPWNVAAMVAVLLVSVTIARVRHYRCINRDRISVVIVLVIACSRAYQVAVTELNRTDCEWQRLQDAVRDLIARLAGECSCGRAEEFAADSNRCESVAGDRSP